MAAWRGHREVVKLLVDKGANLEAQNKGGQTALLRAAWDGHAEVVKLLVDKGANLDAQDNEGWTALFLAARYDNVPAAVVLLEAGADLATKNENGETPLHKVLRTRERLEGIVEELIERNNQTGEPSNGKLEAIVYNLVQNSLEDDIAFSYLRKILLYYQANDATSSVKVLRLVAVLVDSSLQSFKFSDTDFSKLGKLVACSLQETLQSNFFYKPLATLALLAGVLGNRAGFRKQVKDDLLSLRSKVIQLAIAALSIPEMDGENVALEALGYSCDDISKGTFLVLHKLSDMGPVQGAAPFAFLMANSVEELIMVPQLQSSIDKIFYKRRNVIIPSEEIYQLSVLSKDQLFQNKGQYITPNTQICLDDSTFQGHREELKLTDKYLGKPLQFLLFEIFMNWKAQDWRMLPTLFFISQFIFHGLYFALTVVVFWHSEMASWCTSTLFMMTIGYAAEEIHQVVSEHSVRHYINDPWNLFDLLFLVSFFTWYATGQDAWLALNMFLVPFRLLHYLRIFETFGIFVAVLLRMMVATARFLIFYAVILFGFAAMMFALYGNQNIEGFGSFPDACRTLFDASLGNYDLYSFDEMDEYPWVGVALLVSFLLLALVMALNLLIAILSEEYSQLAGCAYMEWCFMYAKIAQENVVLESKFPDTSSLKLPPPLSLISFLAQLLVWISFYLQSTAVNKGFDTPIEITSNPVHESAPKSQSAGLQNDEPEQQHQASIANLAAQPSVQVKVLQRIATILQLTAIILVASVDLVVHILTGLLWMLLAIYVQSFKMMLGQADVPDYVLELLSCSFLKPERKTKLLMVTGCFLWFFAGVPFVSVFVFFWCTRSSVQAYAFLMPGKAEPKTTSSKARPNNTKHVLEQVKGAILNCAITDDGNEFAQVLSEVSNVKAEVLGKVATVENQVAKVESQVAKVERQVEAQVGELKAHMGELKAQVEAQGGKLEAMMARLLEAQGLATPTPAMEESVTKEEGDGTGGLAPAGVDETKSSS